MRGLSNFLLPEKTIGWARSILYRGALTPRAPVRIWMTSLHRADKKLAVSDLIGGELFRNPLNKGRGGMP